ncbi:hypothetical protein IC608_08315 [Devosia sp. PTR5]|uniref:Uncharacterized protein n=1 Tax=Devosia oryzisoli TaxID=2774138 RepID=A0A927IT96_9HYPH|nr:hypothetical protein [Devosia oryzisoli]MBD8065476.1 hypothetical protein [Devosia oryzisoli]
MRTVIGLAVLLLTSPVAAQPFHHPYGEWREYNRDWLAACPDVINEDAADYYGNSCFASTGSVEVNDANLPAYKLTLLRNRLDGALDLAVTVAPTKGQFDPDRPMTLQFPGDEPVDLHQGVDFEIRYNTINQFFLLEPRKSEIIEHMKRRNAVILSVPLKEEMRPVVTRLSLQGVMASLDFMTTYARKVTRY